MPVKQTSFENYMTKAEIAHNEQFVHFQQCFQLFPIIILSILEIFHVFKVICYRFVVCGKGFIAAIIFLYIVTFLCFQSNLLMIFCMWRIECGLRRLIWFDTSRRVYSVGFLIEHLAHIYNWAKFK